MGAIIFSAALIANLNPFSNLDSFAPLCPASPAILDFSAESFASLF